MRLAGKEKKGKANADYGANRAGKAVGKRSWEEETRREGGEGERAGGACA